MKTRVIILIILCCVSISGAAVQSVNLFSDNFNRPDDTDIDVSLVGMSGTLSPLVYVEIGDNEIYPVQSGTGNPYPELTSIVDNQLYMAYGTNMTTMYLDYNFNDSEITTAGGMRIGLTIVDGGNFTDNDRFVGFGVGNTLSECQNVWFDFNGDGFRGRIGNWAGFSDLWIGWSPNLGGKIQVYKNGPTSEGGENYAIEGIPLSGNGDDRLELELFFDSFADGSMVNANIVWNGEVVGTEKFAWDADGLSENYIGLNARQGNRIIVDDLAIDAIYDEHSKLVAPAEPPSIVTVPGDKKLDLQWTKGKDGTGSPNPDVNKYYVYVTDELINGDPNFASSGADTYTVNEPDTFKNIDIDYDQVKYWRVDQSVEIDGNDSGPNDPNTITGFVWQFETQKSLPVIAEDGDPVSLLRYPYTDAENYEGDAVFTCTFSNLVNPVNVSWYAASDPNNAIVTGGDFVVTDPANNGIGIDVAATLTISNVVADYEDAYYCEFALQSDPGTVVATSASADLGVRRQVAHWKLDSDVSGYDNGLYIDSSGEGHHAEPNALPDPESDIDFPAGVDASTNESLNLVANPLYAADSGVWHPAMHTGEITISAWVNWAGQNSQNQVLVCGRNYATGVNSWFFEVINGQIQVNAPGYDAFGVAMPYGGEWMHVAMTAAGGSGTLYIDGLEAESSDNYAMNVVEIPVYLASSGRQNGTLINAFNGQVDDVQIFNYAMTAEEIVDNFYNAILGESVCLYPDDTFDIANTETGLVSGDEGFVGDCRVNLSDFAEFASHWLYCGYYPTCPYNN